jgi:aspartokinase
MLDDAFPEIGVKLGKEPALVAVTGSPLKPDEAREMLLKEHIDLHAVSPRASGKSVCGVISFEHAEQAVRILHSHVIT